MLIAPPIALAAAGVAGTAPGTMQRTLHLSREIDQANVQASYVDGVLRLMLPKTQASSRKRVQVR